MAAKTNTTTKTAKTTPAPKDPTVKAPRLSKLERLMKEITEAQAAVREKALKKVEGLEARYAAALTQREKADAKVRALGVQLNEAKAEVPLVTDGVGVTDEQIAAAMQAKVPAEPEPEPEPESEPEPEPENVTA